MQRQFLRYMLMLLFVIMACTLFSQPVDIVLKENFNNNQKEWDEYNTTSRLAKVWSNKYLLINRKNKIGLQSDIKVFIDQNKDFSIISRIAKMEGYNGDGYGLCWGKKDKDNCFTFTLSGNGIYEIGKWEHGNWLYIARGQSLFINKLNGSNKIEIRKIEDQLFFYINDSIVESQPFERFFGHRIGFVVYNKISVEVSSLIVRGTSSKPTSSSVSNARLRKQAKGFDELEIRNLSFESSDGGKKLTPMGKGYVTFKLANPNDVSTREMSVWLSCMSPNQRIIYPMQVFVSPIPPNKSREIRVPIEPIVNNFIDCEQIIRVQVHDQYGLVTQAKQLTVYLEDVNPGRIVIQKYKLNDSSDDSSGAFTYGNGNGIPEPGEAVQVTMDIQNLGDKLSNLTAKIYEERYSQNLALEENGKLYPLGDLEKGEQRQISFNFFSSRSYKSNELPFSIRFSEKGGGYYSEQNIGLKMSQQPPIIEPFDTRSSAKSNSLLISELERVEPTDKYSPNSYAVILGCPLDAEDRRARNDALRFYHVSRNILGIPEENMLIDFDNRFLANDMMALVDDLGWLSQKIEKGGSRIFIYFTGSGSSSQRIEAIELLNALNPQYAAIRKKENNLFDQLEGLRAEVIMVVDPAFSGDRSADEISLAQNSGLIIPSGNISFENHNISYIAPGGTLNYSSAFREKKYNLFGYFFTDILLRNNQDRVLPINQMVERVNNQMHRFKTYGERLPIVEVYGQESITLVD